MAARLALFLCAFLVLPLCALAQCPTPLTPTATATLGSPELDYTPVSLGGSGIASLGGGTNGLTLHVVWDTVAGRSFNSATLGDGSCDAQNLRSPGWAYTDASPNCSSSLYGVYNWSSTAFYTGPCLQNFRISTTPSATLIEFNVTVVFSDQIPVVRGTSTSFFTRITTKSVPVAFSFQRTVNVSATINVFSATGISMSAVLTREEILNESPFLLNFTTILGPNFTAEWDADAVNVSSSSSFAPIAVEVAGATTVGATRNQLWSIALSPDAPLCILEGSFSMGFLVTFTGVGDNPIPDGAYVSITMTMAPQRMCAQVIPEGITADLTSYASPPDALTFYSSPPPVRSAFLTNTTAWFRGRITSARLPITQTDMLNFWVTTENVREDLVVASTSRVPAVSFAYVPAYAVATEDAWSVVLDPAVFAVPQDSNLVYVFHATLRITYDVPSASKRGLVARGLAKRQTLGPNLNAAELSGVINLELSAPITTTMAPVTRTIAPAAAPAPPATVAATKSEVSTTRPVLASFPADQRVAGSGSALFASASLFVASALCALVF